MVQGMLRKSLYQKPKSILLLWIHSPRYECLLIRLSLEINDSAAYHRAHAPGGLECTEDATRLYAGRRNNTSGKFIFANSTIQTIYRLVDSRHKFPRVIGEGCQEVRSPQKAMKYSVV